MIYGLSHIGFRTVLERCWQDDTTYASVDEYERNDPAYGQCAVSALLVHEYFGGDILRGKTVCEDTYFNGRHYWNIINGVNLDFTWRQFPAGTAVIDIEIVDVKKLLAGKDLRERYQRLKDRFADNRLHSLTYA